MPPRIIAQQFAHLKGLLGRMVALLMNWHNAEMNAFVVQLLQLTPADRVLEIRFGGGATLSSLIEWAGFVGGIDQSPDVVAWAKADTANAVREGRADLREGRVEALPFETASFRKVCTMNTVYFWDSLDAALRNSSRHQTRRPRADWLSPWRANEAHENAAGHLHIAHNRRRCRERCQCWIREC